MTGPQFYLGTHHPDWLGRVNVPLFVSHRRLDGRRTFPRAIQPWALDSGAFTDIARHGEFTTTPRQYVAAVRRYRDEIGHMDWAAPQDHMCEPFVLARSTVANTVADAQAWTVRNYLTLRDLAPDLPFVPVIQGQLLDEYRTHVDSYARAGVDLTTQHLVGIGSVCRRQATDQIANLIAALDADGLHLHGFGVKLDGLRRYGWCLRSADSMAWSYWGRRTSPCPHTGVTSCANCLPYALAWRARAVEGGQDRPVQLAWDMA